MIEAGASRKRSTSIARRRPRRETLGLSYAHPRGRARGRDSLCMCAGAGTSKSAYAPSCVRAYTCLQVAHVLSCTRLQRYMRHVSSHPHAASIPHTHMHRACADAIIRV
eukprot:5023299-Pleurochrysis_carterae.AAC.1